MRTLIKISPVLKTGNELEICSRQGPCISPFISLMLMAAPSSQPHGDPTAFISRRYALQWPAGRPAMASQKIRQARRERPAPSIPCLGYPSRLVLASVMCATCTLSAWSGQPHVTN